MEAIILAGGRGSRLQSVVPDVPKPMAEVKGVPFLEHLMTYWIGQGVTRFILSVGYRAEQIIAHFGSSFGGVPVVYAREQRALGTGGAIGLAVTLLSGEGSFLVVNGDTLFGVSLERLADFHLSRKADLTLAIKRLENNDRYGGLQVDSQGRVNGFFAPETGAGKLVNGGVYLIDRNLLRQTPSPSSFENDVIPRLLESGSRVYALEFDTPFLDIGIPDDYRRAEEFVDLI